MISVGIYGGRGYVARELGRLIIGHPMTKIAWWYSRAGGSIEEAHRNLLGTNLCFVSEDNLPNADVVFLCTPVGVAMDITPILLERGSKVITMAADFRIKDKKVFEDVYGPHKCWDLAEEAVYGIPELHRDAIRSARLIANPGCFSSAVILALAPLVKLGGVDLGHLVVDGISGTSGAGAGLDRSMHHPEMWQTVIPYNVVDHRHSYEMESQLSAVAGKPVTVHFTSYYGCFGRGILVACHVFFEELPDRKTLLSVYENFYREHSFVSINRLPRNPEAMWNYIPYPSVADVAGSNYCQIGLDVDLKRGRIVIFAAIDNMGKGACGVAVQNMNLMFNLEETTGIIWPGLGI